MKRALITGITGMDGSVLADLLLSLGYVVYGMERRTTSPRRSNVLHLYDNPNMHFIQGDLGDQNSILRVIQSAEPDEIYNLGAQSFVHESWNTPENTSNITGLGVLRVLESIRMNKKPIKYYQASSSEMFGKIQENPAKETTPFYPRSPYGVAKVYAHWMTKNYRESYEMFNCCGMLFNHEHERRGAEFVTRKISMGVAKIKMGLADKIVLGNLDAGRDWGYAGDFVRAMYLMMQHDVPDDFVIATGITHTVRDFVKAAFECAEINNWEDYVEQSKEHMRPAEVDVLRGDATKARIQLGWKPTVTFEQLVEIMVKNDIDLLKKNG